MTAPHPQAPDALVLAGGLGTRLREAVPDRPKVLAEVLGRPFLLYVLDGLAAAGVRRAVLCTGYRAEEVELAVGASHRGMAVEYSVEAEPLGTGGAVRLALPRASTDPLLVLNGDSCCRMELPAYIRWHLERRPPASLVLARAGDTRRFGRVETGPGGAVTRFTEKGDEGGPGWINAGIYLLSAAVARAIPGGRPFSLEREVVAPLAGKGLLAWPCDGPFLDIGTGESYAEAADFLAAGGEGAGRTGGTG